MISKYRKPVHPGEVLLHEFLEPLHITPAELARKMSVPVHKINLLIHGKQDMTADIAVLLSQILKTSSEFWMNLQVARDLYEAKKHLKKAA